MNARRLFFAALAATGFTGNAAAEPRIYRTTADRPFREDFASDFDKATEFAEPGYYRVELKTCGVTAEATATERVGVYRFTWEGTGTRRLLLNPHHGVGAGLKSRPEGEVSVESPTRVTGWYRNLGWVDRRVFFAIEFGVPSEKDIRHPYLADDPLPGRIFTFGGDRRELVVRVAISTRSVDGARRRAAAVRPRRRAGTSAAGRPPFAQGEGADTERCGAGEA